MTGLITCVGEVELLAGRMGMTQVVLVAGLHGHWHLPGVDLLAQSQWANLVVRVHALPDDDVQGRDGWDARFSAGVPADVLRWNISQARAANRLGRAS